MARYSGQSVNVRKALVWPTDAVWKVDDHIRDIRKYGPSVWGVRWTRKPNIELPAKGYIIRSKRVVAKGVITRFLDYEEAKATRRLRRDSCTRGRWELYIELIDLEKTRRPFPQSRLISPTSGKPIKSNVRYFVYAKSRPIKELDRSGVLPDETRKRSTLLGRKYGPRGEGAAHKRLKEWVARNPQELGLTAVVQRTKEYAFRSGDAADVLFRMRKDKYAVVEVETYYPLPGAHQVLKYRTLKCAEEGLDIKSSDASAILVAWSVPREVRDFCRRYGIRFIEKTLI
jgi:hypothetical protein